MQMDVLFRTTYEKREERQERESVGGHTCGDEGRRDGREREWTARAGRGRQGTAEVSAAEGLRGASLTLFHS